MFLGAIILGVWRLLRRSAAAGLILSRTPPLEPALGERCGAAPAGKLRAGRNVAIRFNAFRRITESMEANSAGLITPWLR